MGRKKDSGAQEESLLGNPPVNAPEIAPAPEDTAPETETAASEPSVENTDPSRSANENVEAGGHPTGSVPGGYT